MTKKNILIGIDRDGTLIKNNDFFGKNSGRKKEIIFNQEVIKFLFFVQSKYQTTKIVLSNQSGVARGLYDCRKVELINKYIDNYLKSYKILINSWQYCPDVDAVFAKNHPEIKFIPKYVKAKTRRKPALDMLFDGLAELGLQLNNFAAFLVVGDRQEDVDLAMQVKAKYLDVKGKTFTELVKDFNKLIF